MKEIKIMDNIFLYTNNDIDLRISNTLSSKMMKVMIFFKIDNMKKKVMIRIWDDKNEFKDAVCKLNGYDDLPFWAVGSARNEKNEDICYIDKLSLNETRKIDYHKDTTLTDFINSIVHEFVHICHTIFCNYKYPDKYWITEGIATYLADQYPNCTCNVSKEELFGDKEVPYENYRFLYNYIFENYSYEDILELLKANDLVMEKIHDNFNFSKSI